MTPIHNEEALIYADVMESENANYIPFGGMLGSCRREGMYMLTLIS